MQLEPKKHPKDINFLVKKNAKNLEKKTNYHMSFPLCSWP